VRVESVIAKREGFVLIFLKGREKYNRILF
jgi:hypothetical protein